MRRGGLWKSEREEGSAPSFKAGALSIPPIDSAQKEEKGFHFFAYPTIPFFDGRSADRPWLQELPDPMTQITWGAWVEIHPETALKRGIKRGDLLLLQSRYGSI